MKDVREILKKRPLLFDGGMGTYYKAKPGQERQSPGRNVSRQTCWTRTAF